MKTADTLAETGGTFSMAYVDSRFLKLISDDFKNIKDGHYLYPLYDVRHFALAAAIDDLREKPETKDALYKRLTESGDTALAGKLAARLDDPHLGPERERALKALLPSADVSSSIVAEQDAQREVSAQLDAIAGEIGKRAKPPAPLTARQIVEQYGLSLDHTETPYRIDSIDYDIGIHRQKLYDSAVRAFTDENGRIAHDKTFYVIGGTDTQTAYAGLLARELMADGLMTQEKGNKVVFLSSMLSFGKEPGESDTTRHPRHIGRLLKAAVKVGQSKGLAGAFILSAANEDVSRVTVHNALDTEKVSSCIPDAFKSQSLVGTVTPEEGFVIKSPPRFIAAWRHHTPPNERLPQLTPIAMPLISGNDTATILATLRKMRDVPVMLEGGIPTPANKAWFRQSDYLVDIDPCTPITHESDSEAIKDAVRARAEQGIPTYFVNPVVYDPIKRRMKPLIDSGEWKQSPFLEDIKAAGGIVMEGETNVGAYLDAMLKLSACNDLHGLPKIEKLAAGNITRQYHPSALEPDAETAGEKSSPSFLAALKKEKAEAAIGLHYVPFAPAFKATVDIMAPENRLLVLNALPGESLPERHVSVLKQHPHTVFVSAFAYNNAVHEQEDGSLQKEGGHGVSYINAQASFPDLLPGGDCTGRDVLSLAGKYIAHGHGAVL